MSGTGGVGGTRGYDPLDPSAREIEDAGAGEPASAPAPSRAPAEGGRSTIWKKLEQFDANRDGSLSFRETFDVFDKVGLPGYWALVSAAATVVARGPIGRGDVTLDDLKDPRRLVSISLGNIQDSLLKGQSGVFDAKANADPAKAAAFIAECDARAGHTGRITLDAIRPRVEADAARSVEGMLEPVKSLERKKRFGEAYSAWVQLAEVAGKNGPDGKRYLTPEQMQAVFDGKMFDMIFAGKSEQERISVLRIMTELLGKTIVA